MTDHGVKGAEPGAARRGPVPGYLPPSGHASRSVPSRTARLVAPLAVAPVAASLVAPAVMGGPGVLLLWLPALAPAFLLTHRHAWAGAWSGLALGTASVVVSRTVAALLEPPGPTWGLLAAYVGVLAVTALSGGGLTQAVETRLRAKGGTDPTEAPTLAGEAAPPTDAASAGPSCAPPGGDRRAEAAPSDALAELTVLLVDDDPLALRATRRALETLGCAVEAHTNPFEAVRRVQGGTVTPHLLVTDVVMPQMSGFALVDMLARLLGKIPVLYVSGFDQTQMYWSGAPGTRSAILEKPFSLAALESEVLQLVERTEGPAAAPPARAAARRVEPPSPASPAAAGIGSLLRASDERLLASSRIVIIDDDEDTLRGMQRIFVEGGYRRPEVTRAPTRAAETVRTWRPDLVLVDLHMPGTDGFAVMRTLQDASDVDDPLPIIVFSGDEDPALRRRALELGATDFLRKPLQVDEALVRVRNVLQARALHRALLEHRDRLERTVWERTCELADTRSEVLHRLARAADYRDDVTGRHAARVGLLAALIAGELGLTADDRELIRRAAPLHDIGKIGIPDAILYKRGALTPAETEAMRRHTVIGADILEGGRHRILRMAREIAESHHERWDGDGYPHGIAAREIPIEARIVAVADTYDVLTHHRPYKEAVPPLHAVEEIVRCRNAHFDPEVVAAFTSLTSRVGIEALPALVDPVDPWGDTSAAVPAGWSA